ncbi:hypothetical protein J6590_040322 [Homalodisca vitripennis]|nr:hypothetical protein J6590_040322 [Homalodisca vitripennis]
MWKDESCVLYQVYELANSALSVKMFLVKYSIAVLEYQPYSSDPAPCDFYLFPKSQDLKYNFQYCFQQWKIRMERCRDRKGVYIEGDNKILSAGGQTRTLPFADTSLATNLDDVKKVEVTGKTPALRLTGEYLSEGLVINFPLHSAGSFAINMTEVTSSWVVYLREIQRNQTSYLQIDGFDIDMMPISVSFQPASQLDGDNSLGEAVNIILNENSHEVYSIIKSRLAGVFSGVLTELTNRVLSQVPVQDYLVP